MTLKVVTGLDTTGKTSVAQPTDVLSVPQLRVVEVSTPSAPTSGNLNVYPKVDDNLYIQNSSGQEDQMATLATAVAMAIALG